MPHNGTSRVSTHHDNGSPPTQKELVISALENFERPLTAYAVRLNHGDLHAARDAVQHTFMQLCKQPVEKIAHKLAPWLYTVCRNRILDELDSKYRKTLTTPDGFDAVDFKAIDPAEQLEIDEILLLLRKLFACLPEPERESIELWSHGFDAKEIAEITDKKPGTVRVNLHRAIKRLRQHPEVKNWLERATGHFAKPEVHSPKLTSNCTPTKTVDKGEIS
jgi:RNA polymerase sigma-70 factor (ECF subfamily)